jgi:predicted PurR-regulated permease PerM
VSEPPARAIVRIVLIVVGVALSLYLLFLLRKPIGWLLIALFLTVALSGPVNMLERHMRRGLAIASVYLALLAIPALLIALIVPTLITQGTNFGRDLPHYSRDVTDFVNKNKRLRKINEDYDITQKLQQQADKLPARLGGAAKTLGDIGFMLGSGRRWRDTLLESRPSAQRERLERSFDNIGSAVGGYVAGALGVAAIAGVFDYIVMKILGVPFAAPLAVMCGLFSLIPLVGATIAAVIVGIVTLFADFPTATIAWTVWAIVYQQIENSLIQPQVQRRTVQVHPFITIVAVLFGSTLLGVLGAIVAIPIAASVQILLREYVDWRTLSVREAPIDEEPPPAPA